MTDSKGNMEMLTESNYLVWSMKMEALLDAKDLFEDVIMNDEPTKKEDLLIWQRKNKMAFGIIVLSLTAEQAIVWRGHKKAREVWNGLKTKFEGTTEDRRIDLYLELTRLKKTREENIEQYLTRAQGLWKQVTQLGKEVSEREFVRYIVEGLSEDFEPILLALSTNRGIDFINLREILQNFEKRQLEKITEKKSYNVYKTLDKPREKMCFNCGKTGHFQRDCYKNYQPKRKSTVENHRNNHRVEKETSFFVREFDLMTHHDYRDEWRPNRNEPSELAAESCFECEWHLDSASIFDMTPFDFNMKEVKPEIEMVCVEMEDPKENIESTCDEIGNSTTENNQKSLSFNNNICEEVDCMEIENKEEPDNNTEITPEDQKKEVNNMGSDCKNDEDDDRDRSHINTIDKSPNIEKDPTPHDENNEENYEINLETVLIPDAYQDFVTAQDKEQWEKAMNEEEDELVLNEIDTEVSGKMTIAPPNVKGTQREEALCLDVHKIWAPVKRPQSEEICWIPRIKEDPIDKKYEARLVAKRCDKKQAAHFTEYYPHIFNLDTG